MTLIAALGAIARKLLIAVWHVLTHRGADRYAEPARVACSLFGLAYQVGVARLADGQSAKEFTRAQRDQLGLSAELEIIPWDTKRVKLPWSRLKPPDG